MSSLRANKLARATGTFGGELIIAIACGHLLI